MSTAGAAWTYLGLAIGFEIAGTVCVKLSEGFTRLHPSLLIAPLYATSFVLLTFAVRHIPISVAYAVWSAVGTAVIATVGIVLFREPVSLLKILFLGVIILGVAGLHLADQLSARSASGS